MTRKYAYLIDSTLAPNLEYFEQHDDFYVMPSNAVIDGHLYKDMIEITVDEFYQALREGKDMKTSQPSLGEFLEKYEQIASLGYTDIFVFPIGSVLSGTIQSAIAAIEMIDTVQVHVIDSKTVTAVGAAAIEEIAKFASTCEQPDEIIAYAEDIFDRIDVYGAIYSLDALKKGGRISPAKAVLGNMLNIIPLIVIHHGEIDVVGTARTQKKSIKKLLELASERPFEKIVLFHSSFPEMRDALVSAFEAEFPNVPYVVCELCPVVGVHVGDKAGAIGVIWQK